MISKYIIIGQLLTALSYIFFWISRFKKNKKNMLLWDNFSRLTAIISFIFLGTYDGVKNTLYATLRNILGQVTDNRKKTYRIVTFCAMLLLLILMYIFDFHGISTICIALCGIFNLYGVIMCKEQGIRIFGMIGSVFYALFMIFTKNIIGVICEVICFFVVLASYIKYKKEKEI